jgi:protein-tyrosine phosphatase
VPRESRWSPPRALPAPGRPSKQSRPDHRCGGTPGRTEGARTVRAAAEVTDHGVTELLFVCTGNVCRSPAAERLVTATLGGAADLRVGSAGTRALVGRSIDPPMAELLRTAGADPEDFQARAVTADLARRADVVVVMTREQRSAVMAVAPAAVRRTFLLRELAQLAERVPDAGWPAQLPPGPGARLAALPALAPAYRASADRAAGDLEVPDPYRQSPEVYAEVMRILQGAVGTLVEAIGDRRPQPVPGTPIE